MFTIYFYIFLSACIFSIENKTPACVLQWWYTEQIFACFEFDLNVITPVLARSGNSSTFTSSKNSLTDLQQQLLLHYLHQTLFCLLLP